MLKLNEIYNINCLEGMKLIDDESVDLIATDPPYKTTARGCAGNSGGMLQKKINKSGNVFKENNIKPSDYAKELYRILKNDKHCYIMTNHKNLIEMLQEFTNAGFHFIKSIIWDKGNKIMGQYYMSQFEYILFFRKGAGIKINNCGTSDILSFPNKKDKDADGNNLHDTQKPIKLMEVLIENSSNKNEIVVDPFMGVGTTALACINTNRKYIGFELDKDYFKAAQKRINDFKSQISIFDLGDHESVFDAKKDIQGGLL